MQKSEKLCINRISMCPLLFVYRCKSKIRQLRIDIIWESTEDMPLDSFSRWQIDDSRLGARICTVS